MSKAVKELVRQELIRRFKGTTSMAVVGLVGVDAVAASEIRKRLVSKGIRLMVVKNALAKQAFKTVGLDVAGQLLDGPCAIATGGDSVVEVIREMLEIRRQRPELTVKAAVLEGHAFGPDTIDELSKYPTRDEAVRKLLSCITWLGACLAGCLVGPGRKVASLVKSIQDRPGGDAGAQDKVREGTSPVAVASAASASAAATEEK